MFDRTWGKVEVEDTGLSGGLTRWQRQLTTIGKYG